MSEAGGTASLLANSMILLLLCGNWISQFTVIPFVILVEVKSLILAGSAPWPILSLPEAAVYGNHVL